MATRMRKIVVASDSFKGSVSSLEVAEAVEVAVHAVFPDCEVVKIPVGDGGEGTVDALIATMGGKRVSCVAHDPLMRSIKASYGILGDNHTAVIEMAETSGLALLSPRERNPWLTTTYGTGELIKDALLRGCRRFLIGIGGSATNDGSTGLLRALGFRFLDREGRELGLGGRILGDIGSVDRSDCLPALSEASFIVACDVKNPFYGEEGAAYVFAPQKGADEAMTRSLDAGLRNLAEVIRREGRIEVDNLPGAGAAGGLGGGMVAFLGAELKPGIQMVLDVIGFDERIRGADLIITGEGKLDAQTFFGKTPWGVSRAALKRHIPVIVIGGSVEEEERLERSGFLAALPILPGPVFLERAMDKAFTRQNIIRTVKRQMRVIRYFSS